MASVIVEAEIQRRKIEVLAEAEKSRIRLQAEAEKLHMELRAEADKRRIELTAQAEGEKLKLLKQGEADGLKAYMAAQADGTLAQLAARADGFRQIIGAAGAPEQAARLMVTGQLPKLVEAQVKAVSSLKIDKVTVWDSGKGENGKTKTADFLSGLVGSVPLLHEIERNAGVELPEYLGKAAKAGDPSTGETSSI
jgi:flotillin